MDKRASVTEQALRFCCAGEHLYGVLSVPEQPCTRGVLIVVGGPQYRAGSHRQFTLLARELAAHGVAALRFDVRGMGDSHGQPRRFDDIGDDIRAALDAFMLAQPGLQEVVLWGLCDAASAILLTCANEARVCGIVLLNPWIRTEQGLARTTLRHYYRARLSDPAFWRHLFKGGINWRQSLSSWLTLMRKAMAPATSPQASALALPERMRAGLARFQGPVLLVLARADLTAREFCDHAQGDAQWRTLLAGRQVTRRELDGADHTFSRSDWRDQVARWTIDWLRSW